jgi:cytochrome c peroxidase
MMHTGYFLEFTTIIEHYNEVIPDVNNTTMDPRLAKGPSVVKMELTTSEREDLESFVMTLTGSALYSDVRWSSPF